MSAQCQSIPRNSISKRIQSMHFIGKKFEIDTL